MVNATDTVRITFSLPRGMRDQLVGLCKLESRNNQSELVRDAFRQYFEVAMRTQIEQRAHDLHVQCGCKSGHELDHWLEAEREVRRILSESSEISEAPELQEVPTEKFMPLQDVPGTITKESIESKADSQKVGKS